MFQILNIDNFKCSNFKYLVLLPMKKVKNQKSLMIWFTLDFTLEF